MNAEKSGLYTLNPLTAAIYFCCVALFSMLSLSPVLSAISFLGAAGLLLLISKREFFLKTSVTLLLTLIVITAVNPLVSQNGQTVLLTVFGLDVSLEAILYGLNFSATLAAVLVWCLCGGAVVDGDRIVFLVGGFAPKTALLISMTVKNIPEFARKAREISRARLAAGVSSGSDFKGRILSSVKTFSTLVGCSLEGAVETERQMRARGYGGARGKYEKYKFSLADAVYLTLTALLFAVCAVSKILGGEFEFYPEMSKIPHERADLILYISFLLLALLPSAFEIFRRIKWRYYGLKI